jgi:hypothetical protein
MQWPQNEPQIMELLVEEIEFFLKVIKPFMEPLLLHLNLWMFHISILQPEVGITLRGVSEHILGGMWKHLQTNSVAWVPEWTIPTERAPLVGEVSNNFCS